MTVSKIDLSTERDDTGRCKDYLSAAFPHDQSTSGVTTLKMLSQMTTVAAQVPWTHKQTLKKAACSYRLAFKFLVDWPRLALTTRTKNA